MMNHTNKEIRRRRIRRYRDGILEHVAYVVVFLVFLYLFFYMPLSRSMGW